MSEIAKTVLDSRPFVGVRRKVPVAQLATYFAEVLPKVMSWVQAQGIEPASMPMAVWWDMDMETGVADCQAGCFVKSHVDGDGEITPGQTVGGEYLTVTHTGSYDGVGQSWMALYRRAAELGLSPGVGWEIYVDDPAEVPAERLRTQLHLPVTACA